MQPTNPLVNALLTDKYQITMVYAYWVTRIHETEAVFNLIYRKCPFGGEFAFFVGLDEALRFIENFRFSKSDIEYLKREMPDCDPEFFKWLAGLDGRGIRVNAIAEGNLVFPQEPLLSVKGPLAKAQLLETTLLNQVGFASLNATSAARFRLAVGSDKQLVEFGLRRSQGADGAMTAARSSYIGGFNGTSNVLAGKLYGIPIFGTHAHSYVSAFSGVKVKVKLHLINKKSGKKEDFKKAVLKYREEMGFMKTNTSELEAFTAYAFAFPNSFLALVDTYNTLQSGVPNYIAVALALLEFGYQPLGIRLDSGDLAALSKKARAQFEVAAMVFPDFEEGLLKSRIFASDGINHKKIRELNEAGHEIDAFGIGTHQATCEEQPSIGVVYKLVKIAGKPCIKKSDDDAKTTLPGEHKVYRLWDGGPRADIIILKSEAPPFPGKKVRVYLPDGEELTVQPTMVQWLNPLVIPDFLPSWLTRVDTIHKMRERVFMGLKMFPKEHLDLVAPVKYPVGTSLKLKKLQQDLLEKNQ